MRSFALALVLLSPALAAAEPIEAAIDQALARVAALKMMRPDKTYRLPARGETVTAPADDFLRRRTPEEVLASGLSTGCGDYAAAFYHLMEPTGAKRLYIDAVQLTLGSRLDRDDGHTGVAVQEPDSGRWILVDPTNGKVLSRDWDVHSTIYAGPAGRFWIWYVGSLEAYPAHDHPSLKAQYDRALHSVPAGLWDEEVVRLEFAAAASEKKSGGSYLNPHMEAFLRRYAAAYDSRGVHPVRAARVTFTDGGPGTRGDCKRVAADAWECPVGRDAAMSLGFFIWIEDRVTSALDSASAPR